MCDVGDEVADSKGLNGSVRETSWDPGPGRLREASLAGRTSHRRKALYDTRRAPRKCKADRGLRRV